MSTNSPGEIVSKSSDVCISVMLLMQHRLYRDAMTALLSADKRFRPLAPANVVGAVRCLDHQEFLGGALLLEEPLLAQVEQCLLGHWKPRSMVVITDTPPSTGGGCSSVGEPRFVGRDTPWSYLSMLLASSYVIGPASEQQGSEQFGDGTALGSDGMERYSMLTRREQQVLELIASGASVRECAQTLHIAESTVDNHKSRLMKKLGVRKSIGLVRYAYQNGLAP